MNTHHFRKNVKVQIFCRTLIGEARLWYESLEHINVDWQGLQILFRQQYLKIGKTRKYFNLQESNYSMHGDLFTLTKKTETIDAYKMCIRQVATLLGYGEPQILEVFKTHSLLNYIWYYSLYMI